MSIYEKLSLGISAFAFVISLFVYFKNKLYSTATLETSIFAQIASAKSALSSSIEDDLAFGEDFSALGIHIANNRISAQKDLINAYEFACQHYLSGAVNRGHFRNLYAPEIAELFTDGAFSEIIHAGTYPSLKMFHNRNQNHA